VIGEAIALTVSLTLVVGVPVVTLYNMRMKRARAWRAAAKEIGLTEVSRERSFRSAFALTGLLGRRRVRFQAWDRRNAPSGTLVVIEGDSGITLKREDLGTAVSKAMGQREIEIGDAEFDEAVYVRGAATEVRAVLDTDTRRVFRRLLQGEVLEGCANIDARVEVVDGELRALLCDRSYSEPEAFTRAVMALLSAAPRLDRPADTVGRIAENTLREGEANVRMQNILLLASDYPDQEAAREVFRQACQDGNAEVRLRAALALGAEGRGTLLELATHQAVNESRTARAVRGLGAGLPLDQGLEILGAALRRRHRETARACLESLGKRGGEAVVAPLAKVLGLEDGDLAAEAARALGSTGCGAAEAALLRALKGGSSEVQAAAAESLGRVGSIGAVLPLKQAADDGDSTLRRAARQAVAEIQSRLHGASPGQVSLAGAEAGQVSLAGEDPSGRVTLVEEETRRVRPGAKP
jgi:HEAT repeat protein